MNQNWVVFGIKNDPQRSPDIFEGDPHKGVLMSRDRNLKMPNATFAHKLDVFCGVFFRYQGPNEGISAGSHKSRDYSYKMVFRSRERR